MRGRGASGTCRANAGPSDRHINFRIGIHVGDVLVKGGDLFGDGANRCTAANVSPGRSAPVHLAWRMIRSANFCPLHSLTLERSRSRIMEESVRVFAVDMRMVQCGGCNAFQYPGARSALPDKPSIAVLPFQNMSGDR